MGSKWKTPQSKLVVGALSLWSGGLMIGIGITTFVAAAGVENIVLTIIEKNPGYNTAQALEAVRRLGWMSILASVALCLSLIEVFIGIWLSRDVYNKLPKPESKDAEKKPA